MRKAAAALLLMILLVPAVSRAGSATSRWDLTIGGYVRFDMGLTNEGRHGFGFSENINDRYGNIYFNSASTRLNFLTRGPLAWGAKTSAFVEGDFIGVYAGTGRGTFALRQAFMTFDWPDTRLVVGQTFQKWGFLPTYSFLILGGTDLSPFIKGHRQPMIRLEHRFARDWNLSFALMSPTNTLGSNRFSTSTGVVDGFTRSQMPFYEATVGWSTNAYGNIGPWRTLFSLEGFYGREKKVVPQFTGPPDAPTSLSYADKDLHSWGIALKGFLPLIPERKGDKKGALSVSGVLFVTQNPSWLQSRAYTVGSYARPDDFSAAPAQPLSDPVPDFAAPRAHGGWGQISYFVTDQLYLSGWFGYLVNDTSRAFNAAMDPFPNGLFVNSNAVRNAAQYIVSLCYDVNQAVRFGAEYSYYVIRYANYGSVQSVIGPGRVPNGLSKDGTLQAFRIGAWYFF
jgi:hypothetical protein